jgi:hypothetical protein
MRFEKIFLSGRVNFKWISRDGTLKGILKVSVDIFNETGEKAGFPREGLDQGMDWSLIL